MARWIFDSLMEARAFVDGNAFAERIQSLAVWTVAAFDALSAAFRIERNVTAGTRAAVAADLVRLATPAVNT